MEKHNKKIKSVALGIFWCLVVVIYIFRLLSLQIVHGAEYADEAANRTYRTQTISAVRGEIIDSEGEPLVTNRMGLSVTIDKAYIAEGEENSTCLKLIDILRENDVALKDGLPMSAAAPYTWLTGKDAAVKKLLKTLSLAEDTSAADALAAVCARYGISGLSEADTRTLAGFRYEMELRDFAISTPFVAASDISAEVASKIKEQRYLMSGVDITVEAIRVIVDGTLAPHVVGRTGLISAEESDKYSKLGYPLNATVGKEGVEKAFESYLRGTEGENLVEIDRTGKVVGVHESVSSQPGNTVELTINKKLQTVAQTALENAVKAVGNDANAGAVVAMNPNTGAIYALATYPSYDSTQYSAMFSELISDPDNPLLNRAISGTYSPGSTFKIATALAGLENGVITTDEKILDRGVYTYYSDYQPKCWIYDSYGSTHGLINVSEAIKTSCNYFFFEVGRRLGIDRLNSVCERLGLGQLTGIEIDGEAKGILASKAYKASIGEQWYGGDTLQAAIGQSYNLFTPLQIASYISTVVNGGTRYQAHLLSRVLDYNDGTVVSEFTPTVLSTVNITEQEHTAIMEGMRSVTEDGTASRVFAGYPISVGGKTGTASVPSGTANGVFVGFAPYENPEIVVCVLIEHGGSGNAASPVVRELFNAYFKLGIYADDYIQPVIPSSSTAPSASVSQAQPQQQTAESTDSEQALPPESSSAVSESHSESESSVGESESASSSESDSSPEQSGTPEDSSSSGASPPP